MHWTWRSAALACAATLACAGTAAAAPGYDDATVIVEFRPGTTAVRQQAVLGGAPLVGTINDLGAAGRDQQFGYGRVNLAKAVS